MTNAAERPTLVGRHDPLCCILDDEEIMPMRYVHDHVHFASDAGVVNWDDGLGSWGDGCLDPGLVNIERIWPNIYKHWNSAAQHEGVRGGDKCERRHNHFVTRFDPCKDCRHFQTGSTGIGEERFARPRPFYQPSVTSLGETPITREMARGVSLGNVPEFFSCHKRLIERYWLHWHFRLPSGTLC